MKKIIITISIFISLINFSVAQEVNCDRIAYFGEAEICLPKIEGYHECYSDSIVKQLVDRTQVPTNLVLGFYIDNKTFKNKEFLSLLGYNNYIKVYGTKMLKNFKANPEFLKQIQDIFAGDFIHKNWESMEKEIDKIGLEVEIGKPIVIQSYNLNESSFTYVMLTRHKYNKFDSNIMAMTFNGLLINDRLIWMAYYLKYEGEETIPNLRKKSNKILAEFLKIGK